MQKATMSQFFSLPNPGLRAFMHNVEVGQPDEYRTPFYKGKSLQDILEGWYPTLSQVQEKWPELWNFEKDLAAKVGPMSIMKPLSERMDDIESYYESILLDSQPISPEALRCVITEFGHLKGMRLRSTERTIQVMKKSTNSGNPYFSKRRNVLRDTLPAELLKVDDREWVQVLEGDWRWPITAILGWRGQEGGPEYDDVKQRVVWMFPFAVNIQELRLYQPLIEACQGLYLVPAWISMDEVDLRITKMFDSKAPNDLVVCTDFSKFDQHFNMDMQNGAKYVLSQILSPQCLDWLDVVYPVKYHIPLCYGWDKFRFGAHGMASGSGGTNADETISHRALQYEAALSVGSRLNPNSQCLGDDGVITYPGITVEDVIRSYTSHGQEMNPEKQYASTHDCVYLRRWHHQDYRIDGRCVGVYSTCRALGRLAEQERYFDADKWNEKMVALRYLSIIENVKYHPLREEFAEYCMKGDKYRLGIDIPGFLDNIGKLAQEAIDYMPDFLGYTKSMQSDSKSQNTGIENWWIVKYLKSKA